jgi:putative tryptophan/tyrosine transport system substrate-binding protein
MKRRDFLGLMGGAMAGLPRMARAQGKRARIGWFAISPHPYVEDFRSGMRDLGWTEGDNLQVDYVYADGNSGRLPELAAVLARGGCDLIVASGSAVEAARTIQSIPIVGVSSTLGFLGGSLGRPADNLTGIALLFDEIAPKWLELLIEILPRAQRIGIVYDPSPSADIQLAAIRAMAGPLGKTLLAMPVSGVAGISEAMERSQSERLDGLIFVSSPAFTANAARIGELVQQYKMPAVFEARVLVEHGGLISYGPNLNQAFRRAAALTDRILKGTKLAELPIERPTRFDVALNLKSAKALGLEIPTSVLLRADQVIE